MSVAVNLGSIYVTLKATMMHLMCAPSTLRRPYASGYSLSCRYIGIHLVPE